MLIVIAINEYSFSAAIDYSSSPFVVFSTITYSEYLLFNIEGEKFKQGF